jgi:hypothetical protein
MPFYIFKCPTCGDGVTKLLPVSMAQCSIDCRCGVKMKRDMKSENSNNTFHPTSDRYAIKKKIDAQKKGR